VYPRAGLDNMEKKQFLPPAGLKLRPLNHPVRSQSLYRLCHSLSTHQHIIRKIEPRETMQGIYGSNFNNSHDTYLRTILHYYLQTAVKRCKLQYTGHRTKRSYTECLTCIHI
jgi:hypothetical protein